MIKLYLCESYVTLMFLTFDCAYGAVGWMTSYNQSDVWISQNTLKCRRSALIIK